MHRAGAHALRRAARTLRVAAARPTTTTASRLPAGRRRMAAAAGEGGREGGSVPRLSVAPMMDYTDRHFRALCRMLSRHTTLYTEMVVDKAILHTAAAEADTLSPPTHPLTPPPGGGDAWRPARSKLDGMLLRGCDGDVILQLGGNDPATLAASGRIAAARYGYAELNVNCGCPSDKVAGSGCFGAAMMFDPENVREIVRRLREESDGADVTVKCRLGVDGVDSYGELRRFVAVVAAGGVEHFIVHARKALLSGLSPQQNRSVPPLRRHWVFALCADFPELSFSLNGGVQTIGEARALLEHPEYGERVAGVMVGRAVTNSPWRMLAAADTAIYGAAANPVRSRRELLREYIRYARAQERGGGAWRPTARALIKPLHALFAGERGSKKWRRKMDEMLLSHGGKKKRRRRGNGEAGEPPDEISVEEILMGSMHALPDEVLDAPPPEVTPFEHSVPPPRPGEREQARGDEVPTWLSTANSARRVSE